MKKIKIAMLLMSLFTLASISNCDARIKVVFGTRSHPSGDGGCEGEHGMCIIVELRVVDDNFDIKDLGDDMGLGEMEVEDGRLRLNILYNTAKAKFDNEFKVLKDVDLPENVCESLGYQSVNIEAGEYGVDYSRFEYGSVMLNVQVR